MHVFALRRALGEDRDYVRTDFGRGYRFIAPIRSPVAWSRRQRPLRWRHEATQELHPRRANRRQWHGWSVEIVNRSHVREATQKRDGLDFVFRQISAPACGDFSVTTSLGGHSYSEAGAFAMGGLPTFAVEHISALIRVAEGA